MLVYQGRDLPLLRSKLLLLRKKKKDWFVDSLAFNSTDSEAIRDEKKPQQEWLITSQQLGINSQIILSRSYNGEILLLDKAINNLFRISPQALLNNNNIVNEGIDSSIEKSSTNYNAFILVLILVFLGAAYYWFKRNGNSVKKIVRTQFASFELSESTQQIKLYHKHENKAEAIIDIVDIVSSEIELNEQNISIINKQSGHGFDHNKEQDLRTVFVKEKVDKMVDGKTRQISLLLTDVQNNNYTICLYMRRGSNRLTKKSYVQVINELIDWCWYVSEKINASNTGKRKIKPAVLLESKVETSANKENELPLHHQAAAIRPKNHSSEIVEQEGSISDNQISQKNSMDTDLVNALEKLVNLQQQGFLTMDEFSKAKEKLLKTLFEK
jgi:hypothetical protein